MIKKYIFFIFITIFITCQNTYETKELLVVENNVEPIFTYNCNEWLGSNNYKGCLEGSKINLVSKLNEKLNNIVLFNDEIYLLQSDGIIFKNSEENIFLDVSLKVKSLPGKNTSEVGLYGLSFHPKENYFLVTYSNQNNELVVEKYFIDKDGLPLLNNSKIIFKQLNNWCCHFAGTIIWSDFFQDFLLPIGDMAEDAILTREPVNTTSNRGKVLFLNKEFSNPDLISYTSDSEKKNNILAYGLRNPWKISEYKNFLFIPDVGMVNQEELNLVDLNDFNNKSNKPFLFGWPYYEADIFEPIENLEYSDPALWIDNKKENLEEYVIENSISPSIYYFHDSPLVYRAGIIGGDVIKSKDSEYYEYYIFADFLSRELFAYDYKKNSLFSIPLSQNFNSQITSLVEDPNALDSVLIGTINGELFQVDLPNF